MSEFLVIAHRGASGRWPENTLLSFQKALDAGAKWLELDVHLSADNQLLVIHDSTLQRTTDGRGKVANYSYADLSKLDAGMAEKIPLLEDVLDLAGGSATVNIELKGDRTGKAVARLLQQRFSADQQQPEILISSLYEKELRELAALLPQLPLALVTEQVDRQLWPLAKELDLWSINLDKDCIDETLIAEAKAQKRKLLAFTVNDPQQVEELRGLGVDGVFTDFPERFCAG